MIRANDLTAAELAALLHFHADAGVDWLVDDEAQDRFAEFAAMAAARKDAGAAAGRDRPSPSTGNAAPRAGAAAERPAASRPNIAPAATIPDGEAVEAARIAAASAATLDDLRAAISNFTGCNLRNSARSTVLPGGGMSARLLVVGAVPDGDDDREGEIFAGRNGELLDRMLAAIDLDRSKVGLANIVPWRPPGNRQPSAPETDICRPFLERYISLAAPRALLLLGNFTARFFFGGNGTIHSLRGQWRDIDLAGVTIPAIATFHPQDLLNAPASKALAWRDLLTFRANIGD